MPQYDPDKHHRRSIRLKGYDYTQPGAYFITLVTWRRESLFGEGADGVIRLNPVGNLVRAEWIRLPRHFPNIHLGSFVVMPNHVHGIIIIDAPDGVGATQPRGDANGLAQDGGHSEGCQARNGSPWPATLKGRDRATLTSIPGATSNPGGSPLPNGRALAGPAAGSLGAMVGQFKSQVTKLIWRLPGLDQCPIWQRNYYEHIIRGEFEYQQIVRYIQDNPLRWMDDRLNPAAFPNPINQDQP